mmetsp:Transcript_8667/g.18716  ORF Transcript_8667/g.18716 Transcript_8667/m.18716 type:complete len:222 (-) Transcript_8667:97-762(-)
MCRDCEVRSTSEASFLDTRDEGDSQLLVNHKGQDSHLGGTSVVQFNGTLLQLGFFGEGVPSEVDGTVTEVTGEFSSGDVLHDGEFQKTNKGNDLANTASANIVKGGESVADIGESESGVVDGSWKTDSGLLDEVSSGGKHTNTSVLEFDVSKTGELLFVTIGNKVEGIEKSKRWLGTELVLESLEGGGGGGLVGRGKGGGRSDEGNEDSRLHFDKLFVALV